MCLIVYLQITKEKKNGKGYLLIRKAFESLAYFQKTFKDV